MWNGCTSRVAFTTRQCCMDPTGARSSGSRIHGKLLPVDIETILVFAEVDGKVGNVCLDGFQLPAGNVFVNSWAANGRDLAFMFCCLRTTRDISQHHCRVVISVGSSIDAPGA